MNAHCKESPHKPMISLCAKQWLLNKEVNYVIYNYRNAITFIADLQIFCIYRQCLLIKWSWNK